MSRGDWSFLENLLEEGQEYSTGIGRIWLTVLFLFRMLVLGASAESAWDDEQANFVCNTHQPGCTNVCYDKAFPISHFRYFVLQIIFVSTPTIFYFGYVALRVRKGKKEAEEGSDGGQRGGMGKETDSNAATKHSREEKTLEDARKSRKAPEAPKLKGRLLCAYALSILLKVLLEVGFMTGLYFLYNGFYVAAKFECHRNPCPHTVDCFISRPTEKTIFVLYIQVISGVSLLLNLLELLHLLQLAVTHRLEKHLHGHRGVYLPPVEQATVEAAQIEIEPLRSCKSGSDANLPTRREVEGHDNPCESSGKLGIVENRGSGGTGEDLLPSYVTCIEAARVAHSPRVHSKKSRVYSPKHTRAAHMGHSKQKHYV